MEVEFAAHPCVGGGIFYLLGRELAVLPVGALGAFADAESEQVGRKGTQALSLYALGSGEGGKVHHSAGSKFVDAGKGLHVVMDSHSDLEDARGGQQFGHTFAKGQMRELDEVGGLCRGKLDERRQTDLTLGEGGAGLGIKAENGLLPELGKGFVQGGLILNEDDRAFPCLDRQKVDLVLRKARLKPPTSSSLRTCPLATAWLNCWPPRASSRSAWLSMTT